MNKILMPLPVAVLLAGCAVHPSSIVPDSVSSELYADYSCETLLELRAAKKADVEELYKAQKIKRGIDTVVNIVLVPGIASMLEDSSKPLARAKGEHLASIREYDRRCTAREVH